MTSTWLCLWAKHIPFFQTRLFSSSANLLQGRGYVIPGDAACLAILPEDDVNTIFRSGATPQTDLALKNGGSHKKSSDDVGESSKCDLFSSLCGPIGARNQELINSLRKIIQPMTCEDDIHITKSKGNAQHQQQELCNKTNIAHTLSAFHSLDEPYNKDLLLMKMDVAPLSQKSEDNLNCSSQGDGDTSAGKDDSDKRNGPTLEQLEHIKKYYIVIAPRFMRRGERLNWNNHSIDLIFENHLRKKCKTTVGLIKYAVEVSKIRLWAAFFYPYCKLEIKNITLHPQNGYLKIHWCARYATRKQIMIYVRSFFKKNTEEKDMEYDEFEAISTIYVNKKGRVFKHVVDRRIPIDDENLSPMKNLAAKTVGMVGLSTNSSCHTGKEAIS